MISACASSLSSDRTNRRTERIFRAAVHDSAAPSEKTRRTVSLVEIDAPRPPTAEGTPHMSFFQLRAPFLLPRMDGGWTRSAYGTDGEVRDSSVEFRKYQEDIRTSRDAPRE